MKERIRSGRALALAVVFLAACAVVVLFAVGAGGSGGSYTVRAIFDDAGNVIPGEQVKIAGVEVGTVGKVVPTPEAKAAVELKIENPGFQDFREDASCIVRPQALIGEKYVDCIPTQPRSEGAPLPPPLKQIPSGHEGEGQYLLPVGNNHSPVDVDLLGDIQRLPERERFTIILNELGAGLAYRGSDLNAVIKRANPALAELEKVLAILASQNKVLSELAVNSNKALGPWAGVRAQFANFIAESEKVSQASANQSAALKENLAAFPAFLEQLGPAMDRIGHFADETTATFRPLLNAAPYISKAFVELPGFSRGSEKYFKGLGASAKVTGPALVGILPLLDQLEKLGYAAKPTSKSLAELLTSLRGTGGLERIMDFIFLGANTANGYDSLGHFLRAEGVADACLSYQVVTGHEPCNSRKLFQHNSPPATTASVATSAAAPSLRRALSAIEAVSSTRAPARSAQSPGGGSQPLLHYLLGN